MAFYCKNGHSGEVIVFPLATNDDHEVITELGIIVDRDGTTTNRWEDGTIGVPKEIWELTLEETEGICVECGADAVWSNEEYRKAVR